MPIRSRHALARPPAAFEEDRVRQGIEDSFNAELHRDPFLLFCVFCERFAGTQEGDAVFVCLAKGCEFSQELRERVQFAKGVASNDCNFVLDCEFVLVVPAQRVRKTVTHTFVIERSSPGLVDEESIAWIQNSHMRNPSIAFSQCLKGGDRGEIAEGKGMKASS